MSLANQANKTRLTICIYEKTELLITGATVAWEKRCTCFTIQLENAGAEILQGDIDASERP